MVAQDRESVNAGDHPPPSQARLAKGGGSLYDIVHHPSLFRRGFSGDLVSQIPTCLGHYPRLDKEGRLKRASPMAG